MTLRKRMFHTKESQAKVAERFAVHPKRQHMACSDRKYDPGKKPFRKKVTPSDKPVKQKATQKKSDTDQPTTPEVEITEICGDDE